MQYPFITIWINLSGFKDVFDAVYLIPQMNGIAVFSLSDLWFVVFGFGSDGSNGLNWVGRTLKTGSGQILMEYNFLL